MTKSKYQKSLFLMLSLLPILSQAQPPNQLTLEACYQLATQNYPEIKQHDLIKKTADYSIENLQKGYLPQFNINGQASYQSAVTTIPIKIPGTNIPTLSKDQYKLYGE